jgi:predicted N-acetyltransferase YhbS
MNIAYRDDARISVQSAIELYRKSTLGERRPLDRPDIFEGMLTNASLVITAWDGERVVGIARTLTDYSYVAYLADLAVDADYQKQGIGKRLIRETQQRLGPDCKIVLLAAPKANEYYSRLGFEHNPRAWMLSAKPAPATPLESGK